MTFVAMMPDHKVSVLFITKSMTQPAHFQINVHPAKMVVYNFISCLDSEGLLKGLDPNTTSFTMQGLKCSLKGFLDA